MPRRDLRKRRKLKHAIGDRNDLVRVVETTSRPKRGGGTVKVFTPIVTLWMKVETLGQNEHRFNDVNIDEIPTHRFTARFRDDVKAENFLEFKGSYFEILSVEDPDERGEDLVMKCRVTGSTAKEASRA